MNFFDKLNTKHTSLIRLPRPGFEPVAYIYLLLHTQTSKRRSVCNGVREVIAIEGAIHYSVEYLFYQLLHPSEFCRFD